MKKVFLGICIGIEIILSVFLLLCSIMAAKEGETRYCLMILSLVLTPLVNLIISLISMYRLKGDRENVITLSLLMKITVFFFSVSLVFLTLEFGEKISAAFAFFMIDIFVATLTVICARISKSKVRKSRVESYKLKKKHKLLARNNPPFYGFEMYKAKWSWEDAAREYLKKSGKNDFYELTEYEKDKIYNYALMPVCYFFYWLLDKGLMSDKFYNYYTINEIDEIRKGHVTPIEFLVRQRDYTFLREDISEKILPFVDRYFAKPRVYNGYSDLFIFDYYEFIKNPDRFYYVVDFSWDICNKLCKRIDERYETFLKVEARNDMLLGEEVLLDKTVFWDEFRAELDVHTYGNVTEEYIDKCVIALNNISAKEFNHIDNLIKERYGEDFYYPDDEEDYFINQFMPFDLYILEPINDMPVFTVSGGSDFDGDHGICIDIINGKAINIGYADEVDDLWSRKHLDRYEMIINDIDFKNLTQESLQQLVQENKLHRTLLIPENLGGSDTEDNIIFITEKAAEMKKRCDFMLEVLSIYYYNDFSFEYRCEYYEDISVPKEIYISVDKRLFFHIITVWE